MMLCTILYLLRQEKGRGDERKRESERVGEGESESTENY